MSEPTQAQRAAIDGEGYLVDPEEWDEALAVELAKVQGIELTDEHWLVIRFMRDYYAEHQICADARHAMKHHCQALSVGSQDVALMLSRLKLDQPRHRNVRVSRAHLAQQHSAVRRAAWPAVIVLSRLRPRVCLVLAQHGNAVAVQAVPARSVRLLIFFLAGVQTHAHVISLRPQRA